MQGFMPFSKKEKRLRMPSAWGSQIYDQGDLKQ